MTLQADHRYLGCGDADGGTMDTPIPYTSFSADVDFVRGGTLERFLHDPALSRQLRAGYQWYWVYTPTEHMLDLQCDDCPKRHNPRNLNCSGSLHTRTAAVNPGRLYRFHAIANRNEQRRAVSLDFVDYGRKTAIRGCIARVSTV